MTTSVICIAESERQAAKIVRELKQAWFRSDEISALFPRREQTKEFTRSQQIQPTEPSGADEFTVGMAGAAGWLTGVSSFAVPGFAPMVGAGRMVPTVGNAKVPPSADWIAKAVAKMGVSEEVAKRYQEMVRGGNALIIVHSVDPVEITKARTIFQRCGALAIAP